MSKLPSSVHLIERVAQRLCETDDQVAAELLGNKVARQPRAEPANMAVPTVAASLFAGAPEAVPMTDAAPFARRPFAAAPAVAAANGRTDAPRRPEPPAAIARRPISVDAVTLSRAGMIDWVASRERPSEEFRIVQRQVLQVMTPTTSKDPARSKKSVLANLVMVTSAKPGEGKTFAALNLAGSVASCSQHPVILVDTDSKRHSLTTLLELDEKPGLLDLEAGAPDSKVEAALHATSLPHLLVMPIGHGVRKEPRVATTPVATSLERLGRQYPNHLIVLDTAPCLSSSEPSTFAALVGQVLMLVEAQSTQRAEVEAALDLVEACSTVSLLLNKVQQTGSDTFGAYGY